MTYISEGKHVTQGEFDVVVVGASVAGCTAATLYARQGLSVALVEAHRNPDHHKRACTHFIQATAMPTIRRLGLDVPIEQAGGRPNSLATWTRWGWLGNSESFGGPAAPAGEHGYNIRRSVLDPMFRARAAAEPGVTLLTGQSVTDVITTGGRVTGVTTGRAGVGRRITGRLVVGADGRSSRVAARAGVPTTTKAHGRFV
ncbi:MAG: FAD-dependent monooxygenase [Nakamurella sp.]